MVSAVTSIEVDTQTLQLISRAAHFFGRAKKDVSEVLQQLDGSTASAVALLTAMSREELDEVGGFSQ